MSVELPEIPPGAPLPWQTGIWEDLQTRQEAGRLPHALLITGPTGVGKAHFALSLAQASLCHAPADDGTACGECASCRQFHAGSHPDWRRIEIESKRKTIVIDQVRKLSDWLSLTASGGHGKRAMIDPAERMTLGAANSLLKTLEEPPGDVLLLLVSAMPGRLSATIRSRCQQLPIPRPDRETALAWLRQQAPDASELEPALDLADGCPLKARSFLASDALKQARENAKALLAVGNGRASLVQTAEQWARQDLAELLAWWRVWLQELARSLQSHGRHESTLLDRDQGDLQKIAHGLHPQALHELIMALESAERRLDSANAQLLLESLLGHWARACGIITSSPSSKEAMT